MILHPWDSAEEIDRRLSALNDPELAELLKTLNRDFTGEPESYLSDSAPYWKKRIAFIALAGLLAMSAGYSYFAATSHPTTRSKPHSAAVVPPRHQPKPAVRHVAVKHRAAPVVHRRSVVAPPVYAPAVTAPDEAQIRQARAQLLHERALAAQARAEAARAHHQAQLAMQAQAQAQERAQAQAQAQAKAEALAQARAEALARAQAQAQAQAQADAQWEEQRLQMAKDAQIKTGPPPPSGGISTYPRPSAPGPVPGPVIDPNCTPHRGSLFVQAMDNVRLGDTTVGAVLRIIHP
jgi:chemotaxis protein histidine kinase CheA